LVSIIKLSVSLESNQLDVSSFLQDEQTNSFFQSN